MDDRTTPAPGEQPPHDPRPTYDPPDDPGPYRIPSGPARPAGGAPGHPPLGGPTYPGAGTGAHASHRQDSGPNPGQNTGPNPGQSPGPNSGPTHSAPYREATGPNPPYSPEPRRTGSGPYGAQHGAPGPRHPEPPYGAPEPPYGAPVPGPDPAARAPHQPPPGPERPDPDFSGLYRADSGPMRSEPYAYGPAEPARPEAAAYSARLDATPAEGTPSYAAGAAMPPGGPLGPPPGPPEAGEPRRRSRKPLVFSLIGAVVVLALVGGGISWYLVTRPKPEDAADTFAEAWRSGDYAAIAAMSSGSGVKEAYTLAAENLGVQRTEVSLGAVKETDRGAEVPFTVRQKLSNAGEWSYKGTLPMERGDDDEWQVPFTPAVLHPKLGDGQTLGRANDWGERGRILAADGSRLDTGDASGSIAMLTGKMGTAAKKDLKKLGPAYRKGDPTGKGGVQESQEERLAGTATTSIRVVSADDSGADKGEPTEVGAIKGTDGKDVKLSIDPAVQAAAASAIVNESKPTAFVAVRPSSGEVLAAANVPGGFNRALEGRYPAGSTFKIVSYTSLFASGVGMDEPMKCPKGVKVGGWPFKNAGDAAHGDQSVTQAFATSCNTALVKKIEESVDADTFMAAAKKFGVNTKFHAGVQVADPTLPKPDSTTLLAATSLGQGKLQTSPLHMATVAAAVGDGSWRSPVIVTDPKPSGLPEPTPIAEAENLRTMMRAVVTEGTAKGVGFGEGVHGKSGTAEYGAPEKGKDPPAHGWFVGYRDDVAFAVLVEDGESGSKAAAPLAKKFLAALG